MSNSRVLFNPCDEELSNRWGIMVSLENVLTQSFKLGFIFWIQFFDKIEELAGLFEERDYNVTMQILPFSLVFQSRSGLSGAATRVTVGFWEMLVCMGCSLDDSDLSITLTSDFLRIVDDFRGVGRTIISHEPREGFRFGEMARLLLAARLLKEERDFGGGLRRGYCEDR
ncbi:hypothetical protein GIB67_022423 [Kingdonia uniflora]|uniref:Uncharacterized protein n=1 Tax=Kingdonia uniflora TaxID=39325 RepID=A0A7J7MTZ4_9MAGN|nr:hypothetical protein GIB67_022423 [Kingdonia uniflora]